MATEMATPAVALSQMVDLAVGTPEAGTVNLNVLHTLLHAMLSKLNISDTLAELGVDPRTLLGRPGTGGKDSVYTADSGIETGQQMPAEGPVPMRHPTDHLLRDRVSIIERQMDMLNSVPSNRDLIDQLFKGGRDKKAVNDMWQMVTVKKRVDASEEGIGKLSSLIDDLMRELLKLKDDNETLKMSVIELQERIKITDKIPGIERDIHRLDKTCNTLQHKLAQLPKPEDFEQFVPWSGLEKALGGVRENLMCMMPEPAAETGTTGAPATQETITVQIAQPVERPSVGLGPSSALLDQLEDLGGIKRKHEALADRVRKLEEEMLDKATHAEVDAVRVPDEFFEMVDNMKNELEELMSMRKQDNEAMARIREAFNTLQSEMDKLSNIVHKLNEDSNNSLEKIDELFVITTDHEGRKANLTFVEEGLETKADTELLEGKVNFELFNETTSSMHAIIDDLLKKLEGSEDELRRLLTDLANDLDTKLNKSELDALRAWIERRLKSLASKLGKGDVAAFTEDEAAGLRKSLLQHFHCISCDRALNVDPIGPGPSLPEKQSMPPTKSLRPYTTFELDAIRQHSKSVSGEIIDVYQTPRPCGGSHTLTYPTKRVTGMSNLSNAILEEKPEERPTRQLPPLARPPPPEELDLQGVDGHIYRGRMEHLGIGPRESSLEKLPPVVTDQTKRGGGQVVDGGRPHSGQVRQSDDKQDLRAQTPVDAGSRGPAPTPSLDVPHVTDEQDLGT